MTARTLVAGMPDITLAPGMILRLEAVDPTTRAAVGGVSATAWAIYGESPLGVAAGDLEDSDPSWVWIDDGTGG